MKKTFPLPKDPMPPDVLAFRERYIAAKMHKRTFKIIMLYVRKGKYFSRKKSNLTGKRVKKDKAFRHTMQNAHCLAEASSIVSAIYRKLSPGWHCCEVYQMLKSVGIRAFYESNSESETVEAVQNALYEMGYRINWPASNLPPNLANWLQEEMATQKYKRAALPGASAIGLQQVENKRLPKIRLPVYRDLAPAYPHAVIAHCHRYSVFRSYSRRMVA